MNLRPRNANDRRRAASGGWMLALAAVCCCSCRSGLPGPTASRTDGALSSSAANAASNTSATALPTGTPSPALPGGAPGAVCAHDWSQPHVGCPCCSKESDYKKFSATYDREHPATPAPTSDHSAAAPAVSENAVQQAAYWETCGPDGSCAAGPGGACGAGACGPGGAYGPGLAPGLPPSAWTGAPHDGYTHPTAVAAQYPYGVPAGVGAWAPAGIQRPWPHDEYLFDGGDKTPHVTVAPDWTVHGLQLEDTVAHYDTLDGHTLVEPANRVPLYAPRFAAVRKVYGIQAREHHTPPLAFDKPEQVVVGKEAQPAIDADQYLHMRTNLGIKSPLTNLDRDGPITLAVELSPIEFVNLFAAYEDFQVIRAGIYDNTEKARLAQMVDAAAVWTKNQAAEVILDKKQPLTAVAESKPQVAVKYELAGKPRLRIVKVANRTEAKPGDIVDFTLRFDNIGSQTIGNVTIVDNLTTRLEYVPDTAQCSLRTNFLTEANYGDSLVLRWEIIDPMKPGEGGVIRFRCRVR